jgi:hypothetical protein
MKSMFDILGDDAVRSIIQKIDALERLPLALCCSRLRDGCLEPEGGFRSSISRFLATPRIAAFAFDIGMKRDTWTISKAAASGALETLKWLVQRVELPEGWVWDRACAEAARFGHLDVLAFLRDEMGANLNFGAAQKQLCDEGGRPGGLLEVFGRNNHTYYVRGRRKGLCYYEPGGIAEEVGCNIVTGLCEAAAFGGQLELLLILQTEGVEFADRAHNLEPGCLASTAAAAGGHVNVLGQLLQSVPLSEERWHRLVSAASGHGHVDALRYLRAESADFELSAHEKEELCWQAARSGHLNTLVFLRDEFGADWNFAAGQEDTCGGKNTGLCEAAAGEGHLALLLHLRAESVEWRDGSGSQAICAAAYYGHTGVVDHLLLHEGIDGSRVADVAAQGGQIALLRHVLDERAAAPGAPGVQWGCIFSLVSYVNSFHMLNGNADVLEFALTGGHFRPRPHLPRTRSGRHQALAEAVYRRGERFGNQAMIKEWALKKRGDKNVARRIRRFARKWLQAEMLVSYEKVSYEKQRRSVS